MTSPLQQKVKITGPSVVTANRLADGAVIYRTADRNWSTKLGVAAIVSTSAAAGGLLADAKTDGLQAVDVYVAPVKLEQDQVVPGNLREFIRLNGPTVDLPITFGI